MQKGAMLYRYKRTNIRPTILSLHLNTKNFVTSPPNMTSRFRDKIYEKDRQTDMTSLLYVHFMHFTQPINFTFAQEFKPRDATN
jgi:hypothetical protein